MNEIVRPPAGTPLKERRGVPASPPIRIGHVVSVAGSHCTAILEHSTGGEKTSRVQIGAVVKMVTPGSSVIGIVSSINVPSPDADSQKETGLIEINLAGEVIIEDKSKRLTFKRGVTQLPSIGDPVLFADRHDLTRVFAPPNVAGVKVGTLFQDPNVPARLLIDDLLAKHFII